MLSMALEAWPEQDRLAWEAGTRQAKGLYGQRSVARKWRPATVRHRRNAYSIWLSFLDRHGYLDAALSPANRVSPERLDAWIAEQRARGNRNSTISGRLRGLHGALRVIDPSADVGYLLRPGGESLHRLLPEEGRPVPIVHRDVLLERALELHVLGLAGKSYAKGHAALRDAAIIGIVATIGSRVGELAKLEIGRHLCRVADRYHLEIWPDNNKTMRSQHYALDLRLTPVLDSYLDQVRRCLSQRASTMAVWIGTKGKPMEEAAIAKVFRRRTTNWFGQGHGPHWFRTCITTTTAMESPDRVFDAALVLGHSPSVALKHYNKANATAALHRHSDRITDLRKNTASLAKSIYAERLKKKSGYC